MNKSNLTLIGSVMLAVASVIVFLLVQDASRPPLSLPASQVESGGELAAAHPAGQVVTTDRAPSPDGDTVTQTPGTARVQPTTARRVTLRLVDAGGQSAAGAEAIVHWNLPDPNLLVGAAPVEFTTNPEGEHCLATPGGEYVGCLEMRDPRWHLPYPVEFPARGPRDDTLLVNVIARADISLNVSYADGQPYSGRVAFMGRGLNLNVVAEGGIVTLKGVPAVKGQVVGAATRPGFDPLCHALEAGDIRPGAVHSLTLPRNGRIEGMLRLNLERPPEQKLPITHLDLSVINLDCGRPVGVNVPGFSTPTFSREYGPFAAGDYMVMAHASGMAARQQVRIENGQVTNVDLKWERGATFTAELVHPDGTPVAGAVLRAAHTDYPVFPAAARAGAQALADKAGLAALGPVASGEWSLVAEGPGSEPVEIMASAAAGESIRLGRVVLTPATMRVSLKLSNPREGDEYVVELRHPTTHAVTHSAPGGKEGAAVFEHVPARNYCVLVRHKVGYSVAQKNFDLAGLSGEVELSIEGHFKFGPGSVVSR